MKDSQLSTRAVHDRLGVPAYFYPYSSGFYGGLAGGALMGLPALAYGILSGYGIWFPINLIAATVLPRMQQMSPAEIARFDIGVLAVALLIHFTVAAVLGLVFAVLLPTLPGHPSFWALLIGPLFWLTGTYLLLPQLNAVMAQQLNWISFSVALFLYGLGLGLWVERTEKIPAS